MNCYHLLGQHAHWQINKQLTRLVGLEAALLLSDLVSKRQYFLENSDLNDGWFFNTQSNIELDTTLSSHQQNKAVKSLIEKGFISVEKKGLPAKYYFYIHDDLILKNLTTSALKIEALEIKKLKHINNNKEIIIKNKNKVYTPPTLDEIKSYVITNSYMPEIAQKFFDYYSAGNWHDQQGNQVKNWKQKLIAVWFKPEYKVKEVALPSNWEQMTNQQRRLWKENQQTKK